MKDKLKQWQLVLVCVGIIIGLSIPFLAWLKSDHEVMLRRRASTMVPVIMIPGSSASINRFNELLQALNQKERHHHSVLKIKVMQNQHLKVTGKIKQGDRTPFIVVGFENNHDGYKNIKEQTDAFNLAFNYLLQHYQFHSFRAFGHSNGGLIWTRWLENYYSQVDQRAQITDLMTVGTPYNFDETSAANQTQMLADLIEARSNLPTTLRVFIVIGTQSYTSDGLVPEASAQAAKYIFQKQVANYSVLTVSGEGAQHSNLPQNRQIIQLIQQYLLPKQPLTEKIKAN